MHLQIRLSTAKSPADLREVLDVLATAGFDLLAAGGSNVEEDGEFAFAVDHGEEDRAVQVLEEAGYKPRKVKVKECWIDHRPGQLLECITEARTENAEAGRVIRDVTIGAPRKKDGKFPVQVYSEPASDLSSNTE